MVSKKQRYQATLKRTADTTDDILLQYHVTELSRILDERGTIKEFYYAFSLAMLEKIEVTPARQADSLLPWRGEIDGMIAKALFRVIIYIDKIE